MVTEKLEFIVNYDWATHAGGTVTEADDFISEGWEPADEEVQQFEYGDGSQGQDGVSVNGTVYVLGDSLPTVGTRTWIRYTRGNETTIIGGRRGCRISMGQGGIRPHGDGPTYTAVMYSATGNGKGSLIAHRS